MKGAGRRRVVLHIGPPKTGSTHLQDLLWFNQDRLHTDGVFVAGSGQRDHFNIGRDIRGEPQIPNHPGGTWTGTFDAALRDFEASGCHTAVITDERLAKTGPARVDRTLSRLDGFDVVIVYCMREFSGLLTSQWQERIKNGVDLEFERWIEAVRKERRHDTFWRFHDVPAVLERWSADWDHRVEVITLPSSEIADTSTMS